MRHDGMRAPAPAHRKTPFHGRERLPHENRATAHDHGQARRSASASSTRMTANRRSASDTDRTGFVRRDSIAIPCASSSSRATRPAGAPRPSARAIGHGWVVADAFEGCASGRRRSAQARAHRGAQGTRRRRSATRAAHRAARDVRSPARRKRSSAGDPERRARLERSGRQQRGCAPARPRSRRGADRATAWRQRRAVSVGNDLTWLAAAPAAANGRIERHGESAHVPNVG